MRKKVNNQFVCKWCQVKFIKLCRADSTIKYCSYECRKVAKSNAIKSYYANQPNLRKEISQKSSITKRNRIKNDKEYANRLRQQGKQLGSRVATKTQTEKRKKTINAKYSKKEQLSWSSKGGITNSIKNNGPWNKGLTKETDVRVAKQAQILMGHFPNPGSGRGKCGFRKDIKLYVRSTWEADFVRILRFLDIDFNYEAKRFDFFNKSGQITDTYRPDFFLPEYNLWIEISGWVSKDKSRKLKMFKAFYPEYKLFHIDETVYSGLKNIFSFKVQNWEGDSRSIGDASSLMSLLS